MAPSLILEGKQVDLALGHVRLKVAGAPVGSTINARLYTKSGKQLVGTGTRKGGLPTTSLEVGLNAAGRKLARRAAKLTLRVRVTISGGGANSTTSRVVTLRRHR